MRSRRISAAIATSALLLTVVSSGAIAGDIEGRTLRVGQSEASGFATIGEALAVAADGDTIVVEPGTYLESLRVEADVTIQGDGDRSQIRIKPPLDASPVETVEHSLVDMPPLPLFATLAVHDADATISGLTVYTRMRGRYELTTAAWVGGGSPTFEDMLIAGSLADEWVSSFVLRPGSATTIRDSEWAGYLHSDGADLEIEGSTIYGADLGLYGDGQTTLRGNRLEGAAGIGRDPNLMAWIQATESLGTLVPPAMSAVVLEDNHFDGGGVRITSPAPASISSNRFYGVDGDYGHVAVEVASEEAQVDIAGNRFVDVPLAVRVTNGQVVSVEGNEITDSNVAVAWYGSGTGSIADNVITGGVTGIAIKEGAPEVVGNTIENASSQGIAVSSLTSPVIEGNSVCGSRINLDVSKFAEPVIGANEICPDETTQ